MANRTFEVNFTGEVDVEPRLDRLNTTETLSKVLTPGYLNGVAGAASASILPTDFVFASYSNGAGGTASNLFTLDVSATGVITMVQSSGEVAGPGTSYDNQVVLFSGNSGNSIKGVDFTPSIDSLLGFNGTATPANITAGTNISISGGVISATGSGTGNVVGPVSSSVGEIACYTSTNGEAIGGLAFTPADNSLLGFDSGGAPTNITAGTNVTISGGTISVASGAGNVTGTGTPTALTFPVYTNTTGLAIQPSAVGLTNNTLVGVNAGALANITAGSGITISGGVIASTAGGGNVSGTGTSVAGLFPVYTDTTGLDIAPGTFSLTNGTLLGFNAGAVANITAGTGITISGGVISAPGAGGTITGPGSAALGALAVWDNVDGKVLSEPLYGTPVPNSLVGYGPSGNGIVNITAGANINISDAGVISASGGGGGGGNVTGPIVSVDGGLVLFSGTSGEFIENPAFTPLPNTVLGYNSSTQIADLNLGQGLAITTPGGGPATLIYSMQEVNTSSAVAIAINNNNTYYGVSSSSTVTLQLPNADAVPPGWSIRVLNASNNSSEVRITNSDGSEMGYRSSLGVPSFSTLVSVQTFGVVTVTRVGQNGQAIATRWYLDGDIAS